MIAHEMLEAFVHPDPAMPRRGRIMYHFDDMETYIDFFDEDENGRDMVLIPHPNDVEVLGTYIH